ncbi:MULTISPECIES: 16S rRNA (uracil(1498)-N(3))-methyltransferase [unclassified Rummeliibacillus]|uniref:16S rRNA (uracil(1498)-N(3))-methyltransferase n=1 Tax=unclassified Rummeliibacillus TaxID=2622809 RepID=UPI000E663295|nr:MULTISPECIES: 16S rRNA (uracil(1498)-N(3))-methyltransferase [unclassified Rummeliibacillus]RIJ67562.1 16S rRNA (uracil(1498)-N(3))-methyltransferase [Rummeliibacillus sp. POC4]RPJ97121.1 16S rRNA (uracil(1498)-N(3))-methyltransferase [Rummeliibacillus sp. TYF005]
MQRYFINESFDNELAIIVGDDAHHITKVMRMRAGDEIIVVHNGEATICEIANLTEEGVHVKKTTRTLRSPELPIHVTIACGLPKGDKLDLIVQKSTELGMYSFIPFEAERSIVKWDYKKGKKKQERLQKIAKEAAEQSHRTHIPTIEEPISFKKLLQEVENYDVVFLADEEDAKQEVRTRFAEQLKKVYDYKSMLVIFGPEGGIAREEAQALQQLGCQCISLGPRILRAETAPFYVLSAISYEFE